MWSRTGSSSTSERASAPSPASAGGCRSRPLSANTSAAWSPVQRESCPSILRHPWGRRHRQASRRRNDDRGPAGGTTTGTRDRSGHASRAPSATCAPTRPVSRASSGASGYWPPRREFAASDTSGVRRVVRKDGWERRRLHNDGAPAYGCVSDRRDPPTGRRAGAMSTGVARCPRRRTVRKYLQPAQQKAEPPARAFAVSNGCSAPASRN
jgi:hypothetical protein